MSEKFEITRSPEFTHTGATVVWKYRGWYLETYLCYEGYVCTVPGCSVEFEPLFDTSRATVLVAMAKHIDTYEANTKEDEENEGENHD